MSHIRAFLKLSICFAVIALACPTTASAEEPKPEDVYKQVLPSVMTLQVETRSADKCTGTAFLCVKDGIAASAWHVVRDAKKVTAKFSSGEEFDVSGLIDKDEKRDIALVRVKVFGRPLLTLSPSEPAVGSKAYVIGSPQGLDFSVSDGLVSQIQLIDAMKYYQFSCAASPGNSGGPLVSSKGEALGVVSWQVKDGQNLNFAVPSTYVLGLDASLPTQPWEQVRADPPPPTRGESVPDADVDALIAKCIAVDDDTCTALNITTDLLAKPTYKETFWGDFESRLPDVPPCLYTVSEQLSRTIGMLHDLRPEGVRGKAIRDFEVRLPWLASRADEYIKLIKLIAQKGGWTAECRDLMSQIAGRVEPDAPMTADEWKAIGSLRTVADHLSLDLQYRLGALRDEAGFSLGVNVFNASPMLLRRVTKDGLAYSIGLRQDDTVVSADGKALDALQRLKMSIKERLGKKVRIVVLRGGKEVTIEPRLPKEIPGKYLYTAKEK